MKYFLALLVVFSAEASAHSLEPGRLRVWAVDSYTQFSLTAFNRYTSKRGFLVEAFEDREMTKELSVGSVPERFVLGGMSSRKVQIQVKNPPI